ncbi:MAG: UDP-2,3-diacylglucosamine diphosphatase [Gemmatimonadetes bacterium]|nr:UDP-2,3-diacylglucosamine diphosphatase [Gemmatimonadota bacterium]
MLVESVLVVADAHLGHAPPSVADAFHRFLAKVPELGQHLIINGDLFDFWFEYKRVVSRDAFPTLSALLQLRKAGVKLTVTGGNHDRWGGDFWIRELGAQFYAEPVELNLAGFRVLVAHGDGLSEARTASRIMHHITRLPLTARLFGWIHPDLGFWLADRMSGSLAEQTRDAASLGRAAAAQATFARNLLVKRPDLDIVVLSHTHRAALLAVGPRRWFLNPGAWMDGGSYAALTSAGPELRKFG